MPPLSPSETVDMAEKLSHNMTAFLIVEIILLGVFVVWGVRYIVSGFSRISAEQNSTLLKLAEVTTRNTIALDNVSKVIKDNESELILARQNRGAPLKP
jgi:hypothetical protein